MKRREWLQLACLAAVGGRPAGSYASNRLFNGRDFTGWLRAGHGLWSVEEGAIVGRADHAKPAPGYLMSELEFADFEFRLEFWISRGGNSGVYIREPRRNWGIDGDERPAHGPRSGYEVQIDYNDAKNPTGSLYDISRAERLVGGEERWSPLRIECRGPKIWVWVSEQMVISYGPLRSAKGVIGFQIHGRKPHDHVVKFRNVECTVL
jgi:hypothetical protein